MVHRLAGLALATVAVALAPASAALAAPAAVTVRVEGGAQTLLLRTALTTTTQPVVKDGNATHSCTGTSAAGALEIGTRGNWAATWNPTFKYFVNSILGETPAQPEFWSLWINNKESQTGICDAELQTGDEVLFFVARCVFDPATSACTNPPVLPLGLTTPQRVTPGTPFTVRVVEFAANGTPSPVAGAGVNGGGTSASTGPDGTAALTIPAGQTTLRATLANHAPSASEPVCATDGADGACGTTAAQPVAGVTPTVDRTAPSGRLLSPRNGRTYRRSRFAPRRIRIAVTESGSGIRNVKLRLTRRLGDRCWSYSGRRERFLGQRCGQGFFFTVSDRAAIDYLLPEQLPRGRYVLDVVAIDKAFNRDAARQTGRNRAVFEVR